MEHIFHGTHAHVKLLNELNVKSPVSNKQFSFMSLFLSCIFFIVFIVATYMDKVITQMQLSAPVRNLFHHHNKNVTSIGSGIQCKPSSLKKGSSNRYASNSVEKRVTWAERDECSMGEDSRMQYTIDCSSIPKSSICENNDYLIENKENLTPLQQQIIDAERKGVLINTTADEVNYASHDTPFTNFDMCIPFLKYNVVFDQRIDTFSTIAFNILKAVPIYCHMFGKADECVIHENWVITFLLIKALIDDKKASVSYNIAKELECYIPGDDMPSYSVAFPSYSEYHLLLQHLSFFSSFTKISRKILDFEAGNSLGHSTSDLLVGEDGKLVFTDSLFHNDFLNGSYVTFNVNECNIFHFVVRDKVEACRKFTKIPIPVEAHVHFFVSFIFYKISHIGSLYAIFGTIFAVAVAPGVNVYYLSVSICPFGNYKQNIIHDFDTMFHITSVGTADDSFVLGVVDELFFEIQSSESAKLIIDRLRLFLIPGKHSMVSKAKSGTIFDNTAATSIIYKTDNDKSASLINGFSLVFFATDLPRQCERLLLKMNSRSFNKRSLIDRKRETRSAHSPVVSVDVPLVCEFRDEKSPSVATLATTVRFNSSIDDGSLCDSYFDNSSVADEHLSGDTDGVPRNDSSVASVSGVFIESFDFGE